jgi:hypothetical protein
MDDTGGFSCGGVWNDNDGIGVGKIGSCRTGFRCEYDDAGWGRVVSERSTEGEWSSKGKWSGGEWHSEGERYKGERSREGDYAS